MAAETGGDGLPFLGSVMSLVSHGEIRYEGILCNIDMPNSTIALSNVRCFGTEGRRTDGPDVPPNDQVFEVVVFKGGEIKELTVLQPPAPQQGFQDPAIVSAGPAPPGPPPPGPPAPPPGPPAYGAPPPPGGPSPWGPPPPGAWGNNPWGNPPPAPASVPAAGALPPPRPSGQPAPAPAPTVAVAPAAARQQPPQPVPPHQQQQAGGQRRPPPPPPGIANGTAAANQPGTGAGASQHAPRIVPISYAHAAGGGRGGGGRGAPRGRGQSGQGAARGRGGQVGAPPGIPRPAPVPPVEVPKEEFNFEEALKRFNKEELLKEAEEKPELTSAAAADKKTAYVKDDFFDELSCEALEKLHLAESGEARPDHRTKMAAMRKQDLETFGGMARGRSAGRGYRGRGRGYHNRGGASGNGGRGQRGRGNNNRERGEGGRAPREVAAN